MKIEIRPPFKLDKDAWRKVKQGLFYSLLLLSGVWVLAVALAYLINWLVIILE